MKILFIVPFEYMAFVRTLYVTPLGLLSLATILKENNKDVEIIDFNYLFSKKILEYNDDQAKNMETMAEYILDKSPDIVGFTGISSTFHDLLFLSRLIKNKNNNIKIISGGPQTWSLSEKILEKFPWIDLICTGEGENKILHIIEGFEKNDLTDVPGIIYRNNDIILQNPDIPLIEDMDRLPLLNYSLSPGGYEGKISMETSRGCPYNCIYCSTSQFWKHRFRAKSIERICKEISLIQKITCNNTHFINFIDDNFTTNRNFTMKLCKELQKFDITWDCSARLDTLDEELITEMSLSGCRAIFLGIESGSPGIQKYINKNLNLQTVEPLFELMLKNNIKPTVSFMYGFPEETEEDLNLTLHMLYSLFKKGIRQIQLHTLYVLPGTELFDTYKDKLVLKDFCSKMSDNFNFKLCNSLITGNRDIFPNLYTLEHTIADKYPELDKFIIFIFTHLYRCFPETFTLILDSFANSLLAFYKDLLCNVDGLLDYWRAGDYWKDLAEKAGITKKSIAVLTEYINNKSFSDFRFRMISYTFCKEKDHMGNLVSP